jgi:hypothetical protein
MKRSIWKTTRVPATAIRVTLVLAAFSCFAIVALPAAAACDPEHARHRLAWADDLRDYIELWHDLGNPGEASEDLARLTPVLIEAAAALEECPASSTATALRMDIRRMTVWAERAGRALNFDD